MDKIPVEHTTEYSILHQKQFDKFLSGSQVEYLLDFFLIKTIEPLCQTLWFKNQLCLIIDKSIREPKFKISNKDKKETILNILNACNSLDKDFIILQIKLASLDRSYISDIVLKFLDLGKNIKNKEISFFKNIFKNTFDLKDSEDLYLIEQYFQGITSGSLVNIYNKVNFWFKKYLEFRELLIGKYYRYAFQYAKTYKLKKPTIDESCLFKSLLLSINTALDKYNSSKGALTSYISMWFKGTINEPQFDFNLGQPFKLSKYAKDKTIKAGTSINTIAIGTPDFDLHENSACLEFLDDKLMNLEITDFDLLKFLEMVEDPCLDLVKIFLGIPLVSLRKTVNT